MQLWLTTDVYIYWDVESSSLSLLLREEFCWHAWYPEPVNILGFEKSHTYFRVVNINLFVLIIWQVRELRTELQKRCGRCSKCSQTQWSSSKISLRNETVFNSEVSRVILISNLVLQPWITENNEIYSHIYIHNFTTFQRVVVFWNFAFHEQASPNLGKILSIHASMARYVLYVMPRS